MTYLGRWANTPQDLDLRGDRVPPRLPGCFRYFRLAYRRKRGKGLGEELTEAPARARARAACILRGQGIGRARRSAWRDPPLAVSPAARWGPGYRAAEVEEFIARIEATLNTGTKPGLGRRSQPRISTR